MATNFELLLQRIDEKSLKDFLTEYVVNDEPLRRMVEFTFGVPNVNRDVLEAKKQMQAVLADYRTAKENILDAADEVHFALVEMADILDRSVNRLQHKLFMNAAAMGLYIIEAYAIFLEETAAGNAESDEAFLQENVDDLLGRVLIVLQQSANLCVKSEDGEKEEFVRMVLKTIRHKSMPVLFTWQLNLLVLIENLLSAKDLKALHLLMQDLQAASQGDEERQDDYRTVAKRMEFSQLLCTERPETVAAYVEQHMDDLTIACMVCNRKIDAGDYEGARQICLSQLERVDGNQRIWLSLLAMIYHHLGDADKETEITEQLVYTGDSEAFDHLKELLKSAGTWRGRSASILAKCRQILSADAYMEILYREQAWKELLDILPTDLSQFSRYGHILAEKLPGHVDDLCIMEVRSMAQEARTRQQYKAMCSYLRELADSGIRIEQLQLVIAELIQQYPRRTVMCRMLQETEAQLRSKN